MIGWASETLVATTVLIAAVLVLRVPVARLFGPRAAYALWLAPFLRLLLPPLSAETPLPDLAIYGGAALQAAGSAAALGDAAFGAADLLVGLWIAGALVFLLFHGIAHHRFLSRAIAQGRRLPIAAAGPELIESRAVEGPIATGIVRRRIFVPVGFEERLSAEQCRLALEHERLHHRRGDLLALAASLVLLALHWFNPLAHYAHRAFRRDLEAACDAQLVERLGGAERQDYARAIVGCASEPTPQAICTLTTVDDLKRRLTMLQWNHGMLARVPGAGCAALLAFGGLALTAPVQAQTVETLMDRDTGNKKQRVEIRKIVTDGADARGEHAEMLIRECDGERIEAGAAASPGQDKQQLKVVLCSRKGTSQADQAAMLEKAIDRIEAQDDIADANKAQIVAALRAKLAQLRAR